jgi:hypothetical protein
LAGLSARLIRLYCQQISLWLYLSKLVRLQCRCSVKSSRDRHIDREGGAAISAGPGGGVRSRRDRSGGDRSLQNGLGATYVKCPVAGASKLAQAGEVALGWSTARVIAVPKRTLQCYKCLELGHVRLTCVSTMERGHLCYRYGGSGHRARKCPASARRRLLYESLGAPANHRMGGTACTPPKTRGTTKNRTPFREPATEGTQGYPAAVVAAKEATSAAAAVVAAIDDRREAMELAQ